MNLNGFEVRLNKFITAFINLDNTVLTILIILLIIFVVLAVVKKAITLAITIGLFCALCMFGSWMKTTVFDVNGIKVEGNYIIVNNAKVNMNSITGIDADSKTSQLFIKTGKDNIAIKIDSNIEVVKNILGLLEN